MPSVIVNMISAPGRVKMSSGSCLRLMAVLMTMIIQGHSVCTPAEEGQQHELKCRGGYKTMKWSVSTIQVLSCEDVGPCLGRSEDYTGSITWNGNQYESQLIITEIRRTHNRTWSCSFSNGAEIVTVCDPLEVFAKPVNVTCDQPVLVNSNTDVSVTCMTDKIYPKAGCQFYKGTNKITGLVDITNTGFSQNGNVYYRSQCTLTVPAKDLGQGSHSFIVKMYPDVTGGPSYGVDSNETQAIQLSLPTAALDPDCLNGLNVKDGYIKKGETVRCKCKKKSAGNPPGTVKWKDGSGTDVLTIDNTNSGQSHTCVGSSVLGLETPGVNYSPELAYGPDSVTFGATNNSMYDLCTGNNLQIHGNCSVIRDQVNPAPNLTVTSSDGEISEETRQTDPVDLYQLSYTFRPRRSGHLKVKCLATNTKFEDFLADGHLYMEVRAPPTSSPIIRVNNKEYRGISGNTVDVTNGDVISCHVDGGHPLPNITLSCESDGNHISSDIGNTQLDLNIGNTERKIKCTCIGSYDVVLKCPYREMVVITLLVYKESLKDSSSSGETAIVGGVLGCLLIIVSGAFIFFVLKTKGKFNNCSQGCTGNEKQKQFSDELAQEKNPDSQMSMSQHQNEDFDGYEVPVTPHLYENSPIADNTDSVNTKPGRIGKGNTAYENTV